MPTPLRLGRCAPKSRCPSRLREGTVSRYLLPSRRRGAEGVRFSEQRLGVGSRVNAGVRP